MTGHGSSAPVRLGAFRLDEVLGKGGMGEVHAGVHAQTEMPVAIKVLTPEGCRTAGFFEQFRAEVRAAATLRHEGVVELYDFGQISDEAALRSGGHLVAGSPFVVMERLDGGSLGEQTLPWSRLWTATLQVLDALAHAHARGVVHRDIKPANIMLDQRGGRAKLVDFGIALQHRDAEDGEVAHAGTPLFMAPEQCGGDPRWQGPWTDLYALGCTLWTLTSGAPPFIGANALETLRMQVYAPLPAFAPKMGVPDGFEGWLRRMLHKLPSERFSHAADAAYGLLSLAPPTVDDEPASLPPGTLPTLDLLTVIEATHYDSGTEALSSAQGLAVVAPVHVSHDADEDAALPTMPRRAPPLPSTWRQPERVHRSALTDAGLHLYRMRAVPFVGREETRDQLWRQLHEVTAGRGPRATLVSGSAGSGKTRLVRWIAERAHELGGVELLTAVHHADGDLGEALASSLRRHLRAGGLRGDELLAHLGESLEPMEQASLAGLLDADAVQPSTPTERHARLARYLTRIAETRPVVLLLDDLHHSPDSIAFAQHLLATGLYEGARLWLLGTVSSEALAREPELALALNALPEARRETVALPPLTSTEHRVLVGELLRLAPGAAAQLIERTEGNPRFAVELLGHWIDSGVLTPGKAGYDFVEQPPRVVPDRAAIWLEQLDRVGARATPEERRAVELAAVMGQTIEGRAWRRACRHAGLTPAWGFVDDLVSAGLATYHHETRSWSFAHGMARESLLARLGEARELHAAVAASLGDARGGDAWLRRADHLERAGLGADVTPLLFECIRWGTARSELTVADRALAMLDRLEEQGRLADDARAEKLLLACRLVSQRDNAEAQLEIGRRATTLARALGDREREARARLECGRASVQLNRTADSLSFLGEAERIATALSAEILVGHCLRSRAETLSQLGRHEEALACALRAAEIHIRHDEARAAGRDYLGGAISAAILERYDEAMKLLGEAERWLTRARSSLGLALVETQRGEILRKGGDFEGAATAYRNAMARRREIGLTSRGVDEANLALMLQHDGHHAEARRLIEGVIPELRRKGQRMFLCGVRAILLPSVAALGDWDEADALLDLVRPELERSGYREIDVAEALQSAADFALEAGHDDRARVLLTLAIDQYDGLDKPTRADACRALLPPS